MDYSSPVTTVHGILQARILEWVNIPFSMGFSQPKGRTQVSCIIDRFFSVWATRGSPLSYKSCFSEHPCSHVFAWNLNYSFGYASRKSRIWLSGIHTSDVSQGPTLMHRDVGTQHVLLLHTEDHVFSFTQPLLLIWCQGKTTKHYYILIFTFFII